MLTIILAVVSFFVYIIDKHPNWVPILSNDKGATNAKMALEYLIILIAVLALFKLKENLMKESFIRFSFLYLCIIMIIPSEICFTLFKNSNSFSVVFGHVLKISSYCYLYKGVFESAVKYPYIKLNESNERLSDILNAIPIAIHTYDSNNKIDFVNHKFEELFKCPKEKVKGLDDREILNVIRRIGNETEKTLPNRLKNNEGDTNNIIRTYVNYNGEQIDVLVNAHKIKNGVLILLNDVKSEQEIRNLNLQTQAIINSMTLPTIILDIKGK